MELCKAIRAKQILAALDNYDKLLSSLKHEYGLCVSDKSGMFVASLDSDTRDMIVNIYQDKKCRLEQELNNL